MRPLFFTPKLYPLPTGSTKAIGVLFLLREKMQESERRLNQGSLCLESSSIMSVAAQPSRSPCCLVEMTNYFTLKIHKHWIHKCKWSTRWQCWYWMDVPNMWHNDLEVVWIAAKWRDDVILATWLPGGPVLISYLSYWYHTHKHTHTGQLTLLFGFVYWMLSVSIARIIECMAIKIFWYTILMWLRLSSSEYPAPWIILICFMKVLLPDSPVPEERVREKRGEGILLMIQATEWTMFFLN